jgi:hypothetical protein
MNIASLSNLYSSTISWQVCLPIKPVLLWVMYFALKRRRYHASVILFSNASKYRSILCLSTSCISSLVNGVLGG